MDPSTDNSDPSTWDLTLRLLADKTSRRWLLITVGLALLGGTMTAAVVHVAASVT